MTFEIRDGIPENGKNVNWRSGKWAILRDIPIGKHIVIPIGNEQKVRIYDRAQIARKRAQKKYNIKLRMCWMEKEHAYAIWREE